MADREVIGRGATTTILHTETDGTLHVEEVQDVAGILDYTAAARNNRFDASALGGMMRHEAEIPFTVFQEECQKRGIAPFSPESDLVMEWIIAQPQYSKFLAAPKLRDPGIIIKGAR